MLSYSKKSKINAIFSLIIFSSLLYLSCIKKELPTEEEIPKGIFIDKIAFTSWHIDQALPPMITVSDIYEDNGLFRLYNRNEIAEGLTPSLSNDRKLISYVLVKNGITPFIMNIDGSGQSEVHIPENYLVQDLQISTNGDKVAICLSELGSFLPDVIKLGIITIGDNSLKIIYEKDGRCGSPFWCKNDKEIFFRYVDIKNKYGHNIPTIPFKKSYIIKINSDGTGWRAISDTISGIANDSSPTISPDEKKIAFESECNFPGKSFSEIFIMDIDGTNIKQLTQWIGSEFHNGHYDKFTRDKNPFWTKNGNYIVFQRDTYIFNNSIGKYNDPEWDLYIVKYDGTGLQNLTNDGISTLLKR